MLCTKIETVRIQWVRPPVVHIITHQSNSKVQWTTVNLSGTVSATSTLYFIATGIGHIKPTAIPPSHVSVPVCKLVATLSLFTQANLQCIRKSNVKYFKEHRTETVQEWPQIQVQQKLEKKITTGIQTEYQICTGWHIPFPEHSLDCNQQRTMASSVLQSNTNHNPLGHLLMVQRQEKHSKMHHPLWTTYKYALSCSRMML
jgi:hypothetical protein